MSPTRTFTRVADGLYELAIPSCQTIIEVGRVAGTRFNGLGGELTVRSTHPGVTTIDGASVLWSGPVSFADWRARKDLVTVLDQRSRVLSLDWNVVLDDLGFNVREAERAGEPAILLWQAPIPTEDEELDADGLTLLRSHPSVIFADGDTGKSFLSLHVAGCLARQGLKVGLFDWEFTQGAQRKRYDRLFGSEELDIVYLECPKPLVDDVDRLAETIRAHGITYAIFDSMAFASGGKPEDSDVAGAYFRALRGFGIGSLHLAHINKSETTASKPFGSVFWHNGARMTWFAKRNGDILHLTNKKSNLGPALAPIAFRVEHTETRTTYSRVDSAAPPTVRSGKRNSTIKLAIAELETGPKSRTALQAAIQVKPDSLRKAIKRAIDAGELIEISGEGDAEPLISLAKHRVAA